MICDFKKIEQFGAWRRIAFALAAALFAGACAFQMNSLTRGGTMAPTAEKCGECHVDIYREWRDSPHAVAWTAPRYAEVTLKYQVKECLPCHAPETIFSQNGQFQLRAAHHDEGINCIACHLIDGKHHGPFIAGAVTPHATQAAPDLYRSAALCGNCHSGAHAAWQASHDADPEVPTCQECHMTAVRRKLTEATGIVSKGIVALHEEHDLKRHNFSSVIPSDHLAASLDVKIEGDMARVAVRNLLPHAIPEGDFGFRRAVLAVEIFDGSGNLVVTEEKEFRKALGSQLDPGKTVELSLSLDLSRADRIQVRLARMSEDGSVMRLIAETSIPVRTREKQAKP